MSRLFCLVLLLLPASSVHALELLASIRPLALIAAAVVDETVDLQQLLPNGVSGHDYQLKPSDRQRLARADIILWGGPAHEAYLERSLRASQAVVVNAQALPGLQRRSQRRLDGGRSSGALDPHLWLDPDNAVLIAHALAEVLARQTPAKARRYRQNAAAFATRIALLKAQQAPRFQGLPSRSFIAYHDAYQYLEPLLGLNYRGAIVAGDEAKPSAKHFLLLSQKIRQEKIACLLAEPGFDAALARNVFAGQSARQIVVDEQFAAAPTSATGYEQGLVQMVDGIFHCLSGATGPVSKPH